MFHDSGGSDSEDMGDTYIEHPLLADYVDEIPSQQRIPGQSYTAVSAGIGGGLFAGLFVRDVPPPDPVIVPDDPSLLDDPSIGAGLEGLGETTDVESTEPEVSARGTAAKASLFAAKLAGNNEIDNTAFITTNKGQPDISRATHGKLLEIATPTDGGSGAHGSGFNDESPGLGTVGAGVGGNATVWSKIGASIASVHDDNDDYDVDPSSKGGGSAPATASPSLAKSSLDQTLEFMAVQAVANATYAVGTGIGSTLLTAKKGATGVVSRLSTIMCRFLPDLNSLMR